MGKISKQGEFKHLFIWRNSTTGFLKCQHQAGGQGL